MDAPAPPARRPAALLVGVILYTLTSLVGLYRVMAYMSRTDIPQGPAVVALAIIGALSVLTFWLWAKVFVARNWARWVLVALTALSVLRAPPDSLSIGLALVDAVAVALLLLPATNAWFRAVAQARSARPALEPTAAA